MPPTKRRSLRKDPATAASATDEADDANSVVSHTSSVGSRSSARLKRKRESSRRPTSITVVAEHTPAASSSTTTSTIKSPKQSVRKSRRGDAIEEEGEDEDDHDDTMRATKRSKINDESDNDADMTEVDPKANANANANATKTNNGHVEEDVEMEIEATEATTNGAAAAMLPKHPDLHMPSAQTPYKSRSATNAPTDNGVDEQGRLTRKPPAAAGKKIGKPGSTKLLLEAQATPFKRDLVNAPPESAEYDPADSHGSNNNNEDDDAEHAPQNDEIAPLQKLQQYTTRWAASALARWDAIMVRLATERGADGEDTLNGNENAPKTLWDRTVVWFVVLFVLQCVCYPITLHPMLSTTVKTSKACTKLYQSVLGRSAPTINVAPVDAPDVTPQDEAAMAAAEAAVDALTVKIKSSQAFLDKITQSYLDSMETLHAKEAALRRRVMASDDGDGEGGNSTVAQHTLKATVVKLQQISKDPSKMELVETDEHLAAVLLQLPTTLWAVPPCPGSKESLTDETDSPSLTLADLEKAIDELKIQAQMAAAAMISDPDQIALAKAWVENEVKLEDSTTTTDAPAATTASTDPRQLARVRKLIDTRIERERADGTGRIDYASVALGALVVHHSPSLVDQLPWINRLAATWGLRWYGHAGPEVALTPTVPPTALGQCWAVAAGPIRRSGGRKSRPPYASLTVRLSTPVYVDTVSLEHPSKEVSDRTETAVRWFSVVGYEERVVGDERPPRAWSLGTFEYSASEGLRQEFSVEDEIDDEEVPALSYVKLTIESNWGAPMACLYRFRVHGEDASESDDEDQ